MIIKYIFIKTFRKIYFNVFLKLIKPLERGHNLWKTHEAIAYTYHIWILTKIIFDHTYLQIEFQIMGGHSSKNWKVEQNILSVYLRHSQTI